MSRKSPPRKSGLFLFQRANLICRLGPVVFCNHHHNRTVSGEDCAGLVGRFKCSLALQFGWPRRLLCEQSLSLRKRRGANLWSVHLIACVLKEVEWTNASLKLRLHSPCQELKGRGSGALFLWALVDQVVLESPGVPMEIHNEVVKFFCKGVPQIIEDPLNPIHTNQVVQRVSPTLRDASTLSPRHEGVQRPFRGRSLFEGDVSLDTIMKALGDMQDESRAARTVTNVEISKLKQTVLSQDARIGSQDARIRELEDESLQVTQFVVLREVLSQFKKQPIGHSIEVALRIQVCSLYQTRGLGYPAQDYYSAEVSSVLAQKENFEEELCPMQGLSAAEMEKRKLFRKYQTITPKLRVTKRKLAALKEVAENFKTSSMDWNKTIGEEFFKICELVADANTTFHCDPFTMKNTIIKHAEKGDYQYDGVGLGNVVKAIAQILTPKVR